MAMCGVGKGISDLAMGLVIWPLFLLQELGMHAVVVDHNYWSNGNMYTEYSRSPRFILGGYVRQATQKEYKVQKDLQASAN